MFCSHGKSFVLVGAVSPKDPKVQRSILYRPSAVVDVEISSNSFLVMGRVCFSHVVPDLAKNVRSLAEKR